MKRLYLHDILPTDYTSRDSICFEIKDKQLLYIKTENEHFITTRICPHASGDLSKGTLFGTQIICPLHHYKFNIKTGMNTSGEGYHLKTYKILTDEKGEYINWF